MPDNNFGEPEGSSTNFKQLLIQNKKVLIIGVSALIALFLLIFLIIWLSSGTSIPKNFEKYKHTTGWKIAYPKDWEVKYPSDNDVGFFAKKEIENDLFQEGVGIKVIIVSSGTLDAFLKEFRNKLNEKKASIFEDKATKYNGYPAQLLVYDVGGLLDDGSKTTFKVFQKLVLGKNQVFIQTYTAEQDKFDKYKQQATDVMNTLEF